MTKNIGIFGGSFDPPHAGHVLLAAYVMATNPLDELWVLPVYRHPFKKPIVASFQDRIEMCKNAFGIVGGVVVHDTEKCNKSGTTADLLEMFHEAESANYSIVLGSDIRNEQHRWQGFDRLVQLANIIYVGRGGFGGDGPIIPEISSSQIRELLKAGKDVSKLLPWSVLDFIKNRSLYGIQ